MTPLWKWFCCYWKQFSCLICQQNFCGKFCDNDVSQYLKQIMNTYENMMNILYRPQNIPQTSYIAHNNHSYPVGSGADTAKSAIPPLQPIGQAAIAAVSLQTSSISKSKQPSWKIYNLLPLTSPYTLIAHYFQW